MEKSFRVTAVDSAGRVVASVGDNLTGDEARWLEHDWCEGASLLHQDDSTRIVTVESDTGTVVRDEPLRKFLPAYSLREKMELAVRYLERAAKQQET